MADVVTQNDHPVLLDAVETHVPDDISDSVDVLLLGRSVLQYRIGAAGFIDDGSHEPNGKILRCRRGGLYRLSRLRLPAILGSGILTRPEDIPLENELRVYSILEALVHSVTFRDLFPRCLRTNDVIGGGLPGVQ